WTSAKSTSKPFRRLELQKRESLRSIDHVRDLLDRLRLDRAARSQGAVIVEGPTDERLLSVILGRPELSFFPIVGRSNVRRSAEELNRAYLPGVVCVADSDFDDMAEKMSTIWFLVFTDNADLTTMLFLTPPLDRFLGEWARPEKLDQLGGSTGLRTLILRSLEELSALRRENAVRKLGIPFRSIDVMGV